MFFIQDVGTTTTTPDTNAMDSLPTPVPKPPSTQPMGEVVINVMTSAQLMSETRQNIIPGMLALNAPMIRSELLTNVVMWQWER